MHNDYSQMTHDEFAHNSFAAVVQRPQMFRKTQHRIASHRMEGNESIRMKYNRRSSTNGNRREMFPTQWTISYIIKVFAASSHITIRFVDHGLEFEHLLNKQMFRRMAFSHVIWNMTFWMWKINNFHLSFGRCVEKSNQHRGSYNGRRRREKFPPIGHAHGLRFNLHRPTMLLQPERYGNDKWVGVQ